MHVETRVDDRWDARAFVVARQDFVEARVGLFADELWASGFVDVHRRRAHLAHLVGAIERYRHELRSLFTAGDVLEQAVCFTCEYRRSERHELGPA